MEFTKIEPPAPSYNCILTDAEVRQLGNELYNIKMTLASHSVYMTSVFPTVEKFRRALSL